VEQWVSKGVGAIGFRKVPVLAIAGVGYGCVSRHKVAPAGLWEKPGGLYFVRPACVVSCNVGRRVSALSLGASQGGDLSN